MSEKAKRETWRDWLLAGSVDPAEVLTRDDLVTRLQDRGVQVTTDDFRYWERIGVLPRAIRQRHDGATRAVYPDWFVPLVIRLRTLQRRDNVPLVRIGQALRTYARMVLADGLSMEEVPFSIPPPTEYDPREALANALADLVRSLERQNVTLSAPIHQGILILCDRDGRPVFDPATGGILKVTVEPAGDTPD